MFVIYRTGLCKILMVWTVNADGGDAAAGDAFKRISLLVHPDKHRGHHSTKANSAFRLLKQARDHFDLKAKREAERQEKEEGGGKRSCSVGFHTRR